MHYHHNNKTFFLLKTVFITCILISLSQAAMKEACDLHYMGDISELKDSTIRVPDKVVSISGKMRVDMPFCTTSIIGSTPSIFFLIDHSGSMSQVPSGKDMLGRRFTVAQALIDTLQKIFPKAEVGIGVFRVYLYFDPIDNPRFVKPAPGNDTGAYLPFFRFDSSYAPDGKLGYEITRGILDTVMVNGSADLKYTPTNLALNPGNTNINCGFDAVKHAFQSARYAKNRRFVIFFSDGEANTAKTPHTNIFDYSQDSSFMGDIPTTFTVYFTDAGTVQESIVRMTTLIKNNQYSTMNLKSAFYPINSDTLMQFMLHTIMDNIMNNIIQTGESKPTTIIFNGSTSNNYDTLSKTFTFANRFPLTGQSTNFTYIIDYKVMRDSIDTITGDTTIVIKDSTTQGSYKVVVDPAVVNPPTNYKHMFDLICWKRDLQFYFNDQPVSIVNNVMTPLQLRFMYSPDEAQFQYTKAEIEVITRSGSIKDKETFILTKNDTVFTKFFPVAVDLNPTQNNGVLQVQENDTLVAVYRNNEIPKLPLDSVFARVVFDADAPIHFVSSITKGGFSFAVIKNGVSSYSLKYSNLPYDGKATLYTINGRKVYEQRIVKGSSSIHLPKNICPALYFINIEYHNRSIKKKILIQ